MRFILRFLKITLIVALVIYALLWLIPYAMPLHPEPLNEKPFTNSQFTRVDDVKVHYRYWKSQADVELGNLMLIHGMGGSTFSWRNNITALNEAGYNVMTIDLPPYGYSDKAKGINHSSSSRSQLLWTVADKAGLQYGFAPYAKWHLVGHSMGGNVIAAMAALQPQRAESLVFVDAGASDGIVKKQPFKTKLLKTLLPTKRMAEVAGEYYFYKPKRIRKMLRNAYGREPKEFEVNAYMTALKQPRTSSAIIESMYDAQEIEPYSLESIKQPSLIIWGTEDEWVPPKIGEALDEALYDSEIKEVTGAGHNPMETHAPEFNRLLLDFLTKVTERNRKSTVE